jgi:hypothetical protein
MCRAPCSRICTGSASRSRSRANGAPACRPGPIFAIRAGLGLPQYTAEYICGGDYIRFQCTGCQTIVFQPNTDRGIAHEMKMARSHPQDCCDERRTAYVRTGIVTAWPDRLDE